MTRFIQNISQLVKTYIRLGIKSSYGELDQLRIKLLNIDALLGLIFPPIIVLISELYHIHAKAIWLGMMGWMVISMISYVLNRFYYHNWASIFILAGSYVIIVALSISTGTQSHIQLYLIAVCISAFTYYFRYKWMPFFIFFIYNITFLLLQSTLLQTSENSTLSGANFEIIFGMVYIFGYKVSFLVILLLKTYHAYKLREKRYQQLFDSNALGIIEMDVSRMQLWMHVLHDQGIEDLDEYIDHHPDSFNQLLEKREILHVNDTFCKIVGVKDKAEYLEKYHLTINEEVRRLFSDILGAIFDGITAISSEIYVYDMAGNRKYLYVSISLPKEQSYPISILTFIDLTKQRLAEEALRSSEEKLNIKNKELQKYIESNMQLENFAYIASHDLREPLLTTMGFSRQLKMRYGHQLDEKGELIIDNIMHATQNMNDQIKGLLVYSRVHAHEQTYEYFDVAEILYEVSNDLSDMIQKHNASLDIDIGKVYVEANQYMIKQLFQNLITNGIKFHKDHVEPNVRITARKQKNVWLFSVRDNGIGINSANYEKIFILFKRLHNRSKYDGFGMGLAICKKILEKHHGEIWLESKIGEGTVFYFTLPEKHINLKVNHG